MSTLLMLVAFVLLLGAALISATELSGANPHTLLYAGLTCWAAAVLIGGAGPLIGRWRGNE